MGRLFSDKERIERLFRLYGVHDTEKTYENIRMFMETYADIRQDLKYLPKPDKDTAAWESAPDLFRAMLNANKIPKKNITGFSEDMMAGGELDEIIKETLEAVRDFSEEGDDYYKILTIYYFGETTYRGSIAEDMVGFSHTTCLRKRKTAIKLFGALFWKNILMYWDNSIEEMYVIECEEGRDGSLSERRKMEDDRRSGVRDRRKGDRRKMGDRRINISSTINKVG